MTAKYKAYSYGLRMLNASLTQKQQSNELQQSKQAAPTALESGKMQQSDQPVPNEVQTSEIVEMQHSEQPDAADLVSGEMQHSNHHHHHHRQPWAQCPLVSDAILTIAAHRCLSRAAWLNSCRVVPHHCSMSSDHSR